MKEFTGIDAISVLKNLADINNILIDENSLYWDASRGVKSDYIKTIDYLASCINLIIEKGYCKDGEMTTKYKAFDNAYLKQDKKHLELAQKVIDYFKSNDFTNDFMHNTKVALLNEYSKISGFVAYAYLAYIKQLDIEMKRKADEEQKSLSKYQGNVGDKIQIELILDKKVGYETQWGYSNIYLFNDGNNNIYKWTSSNILLNANNQFIELGEKLTLKGTIKAHDEYNGTKQTVITRCKVI